MSEFRKNVLFLTVAACLILPTPTLVLMYMTGLNAEQVLWR